MPATAKETVRDLLDKIPDDASYEDIRYRTYVRQKVEEGLKDIEEERVIPHKEVVKRMSKWLGK